MNVDVVTAHCTNTQRPPLNYLLSNTAPHDNPDYSESTLQKHIMLACSKLGWLCFHTNVGRVQTIDGRFFDTGLPKGWPDLMIITNTGQSLYVELKVAPNKPSKHQLSMLKMLYELKCYCFVTFSLTDFYNKLSQCNLYDIKNNKK